MSLKGFITVIRWEQNEPQKNKLLRTRKKYKEE